jgi:hypothetical protein
MALFKPIMEDRMEAYMSLKVFLAILTVTRLLARNLTPGMLPVMAEEARARKEHLLLLQG